MILAWKTYSGPEEILRLEVKAKPSTNGVRGVGEDAGSLIVKANPLTIEATNDDYHQPIALWLKGDAQSLDS